VASHLLGLTLYPGPVAGPPASQVHQGHPGFPDSDPGHPEALAKGRPRALRMGMMPMMPAPRASEGVEKQQADEEGHKDQREIEEAHGIAENLAEDSCGFTGHTDSSLPQT